MPPHVERIVLNHREGNTSGGNQCVHLITYGLFHGSTGTRFPTVLRLDLSKHEPPPQHLCERFTGKDKEIKEAFFSIRQNEDEFQSALKWLGQKLQGWPRGGCVAVLINCWMGRHRSVAMAERLAKELNSWAGFRAECAHLDLGKDMERQARSPARVGAVDVPGSMSARGRSRSRQEGLADSDGQVNERRPRGTAAEADTEVHTREASFDAKKTIGTWGHVGQPQSQAHETAGRLVDSRELVHRTRISRGLTIPGGERQQQQRETGGKPIGLWRQTENTSGRPLEERALRSTIVTLGPWEKVENGSRRPSP
ncbi:hypothetical protein BDR22DRAFT_890203 [Usnea florida]